MESNIYLALKGNKKYRHDFVLYIIDLALVFLLFAYFFDFAQNRIGAVMQDPILSLFKPINLTWLIFVVLYVSVLYTIVVMYNEPERFLVLLKAYIVLLLLRMLSIYLLPLEPPATMIHMKDPIVEGLGSSGRELTKDLFFSGHTSLMFLLFLAVRKKSQKAILLASTVVVGAGVLLQHVHFTVDVVIAPFMSYCSYKFSNYTSYTEKRE